MGRHGWTVGPIWRLLGLVLAGGLVLLAETNRAANEFLFRLDARIFDLWQRAAPADEPTGEVVVVGIDAAAIRVTGRWPWSRFDLARLIEAIAAAGPRSLTLDILLTEPGAFSEVNLMRVFRAKGPEAIALLDVTEDVPLAAAFRRAPTALAVAGGPSREIDDNQAQMECADPELLAAAPRPYHVECLLFPLPLFEQAAAGFGATFAEQDLDGVVRRARAFVGQPRQDEAGELREVFLPALPLAALTVCQADDPQCLSFDPEMGLLAEGGDRRLRLTRADGSGPPPAPLTPSLGFWLDFGALAGLGPEGAGPARMVSAAALLLGDEAEAARLAGRHVLLGLTRLGAIDQYTTPLAGSSGTPGVLIQALAADNLLAGRAIEAPDWGREAGLAYVALASLLVLLRYGLRSAPALLGAGLAVAAAPVAASWAAFAYGGLALGPSTPALAALAAAAPVAYGRVQRMRRDLAEARETRAREEERMEAAREIQLGSLPFDADFSEFGLETASLCRPAQEVGGDFFELLRLTDGRIFAAVGDVSGKGLEASLVTQLSKAIAGAVTDRTEGPLGAALSEVAREFVRQAPRAWRREKGGFVTLALARIEPETGEVEFAAAGCEPPTIFGRDGARRNIVLPSVAPLGWIEDAAFETARLRLAPGDVIAMFTDGVTEAETPEGALFGQSRAEAEAAAAAPEGARAVVAALDAAVSAHQAGRPPTDDTTILAIGWRGPSVRADSDPAEPPRDGGGWRPKPAASPRPA